VKATDCPVLTLHEYQQLGLEHQLDHERNALWASMGMGKTVTTLTAIDAVQLIDPGKTLVLAPLRVARSTWPTEQKKWPHLHRLGNVTPIVGSVKQRLDALKSDHGAVYTMNYDNLPWLVQHLGDKWPFTTVISDEGTRLKGFRGGFQRHHASGKVFFKASPGGGVRTAALGRIAHTKIKRFGELTGMPAPNGLRDLWGQMWFLDRGKRLGANFTAFDARWFQTSYDGYGSTPLPGAQEEIGKLVSDICLTLDSADWFDLEAPIERNVYFDLPPKAMAIYKKMEREMFAQIENRTVEAYNAAAKSMKCLQIANGAAYVDPEVSDDNHPRAKEWKLVHDEKLEALASVVAEANGAPLLVAYHFKSDLARLRVAFPKARELDTEPVTIDDWNAGRIQMLLAHPASAGHGLNLQDGGHHIVYFGHWWDAEQRAQILERIGPVRQLQSGYRRNVFIYNIVARDTVDEVVIESFDSKVSVDQALRNAAKRRAK
jgi:SNF2 family DNA or RNA helicase